MCMRIRGVYCKSDGNPNILLWNCVCLTGWFLFAKDTSFLGWKLEVFHSCDELFDQKMHILYKSFNFWPICSWYFCNHIYAISTPPPTVHLLFYLLFVRNCPGAKYLGAIFSKEPKNSSSLRRFNVIPHTSFVACLFKLRYHYSAFWGDVSWKNHRDPSFFGWGRVYIWACQKKFRPYSLPRLFELLYLLYFSCIKVQMHKLQMHTAAAISFKYSDLRSTVCLPLQPLLFTWTPMEYWPVRV